MDDRSRPRRASEWLIELAERPADGDLRRSFDAWLTADPANARDWAEVERTYSLLGQTAPAHTAEWRDERSGTPVAPPVATVRPTGQRVRPRPVADRQRPVQQGRRRPLAGLAAAGLAAGVALAVLPGAVTRLSADAVTATAEVRSLLLADGSRVHLAPQTAIAVSVTDAGRSVRLLAGSAFFEVRPDPRRPFHVDAGLLDATVLGTAFEVSRDGGAGSVAVEEGSVRVETEAGNPPLVARLGAGDRVRLASQGVVVRDRVPPDRVATWRDGVLVANDRPVAEVVDELRRYHRGLLVLRGDRLAAQPLTGVYSLADPAAALDAIADAQGASVYRLSPWVLVIAGR